jgi:hypothetical protein
MSIEQVEKMARRPRSCKRKVSWMDYNDNSRSPTFDGWGLTARKPRNANIQLTKTALTGTPFPFVFSNRILILLPHPAAGHTFLILANACNNLLEIYNPLTPVENAENI